MASPQGLRLWVPSPLKTNKSINKILKKNGPGPCEHVHRPSVCPPQSPKQFPQSSLYGWRNRCPETISALAKVTAFKSSQSQGRDSGSAAAISLEEETERCISRTCRPAGAPSLQVPFPPLSPASSLLDCPPSRHPSAGCFPCIQL